MISGPQTRRGRALEIAIVISVLLHILVGGFATYRYPMIAKMLEKHFRMPKQHEMAALSTTIRIEKRTKPRVAPAVRPQPRVMPVRPQPRVMPRVAQLPTVEKQPVAPRPKPTEIAKIVPRAKVVQATHPVPKGEQITAKQPAKVALNVPTTKNAQKMTDQQIEQMEQRFAQTIAVARANSDPTRVPPASQPATMKRAKLDITGVNELLRRGE